MHAVQFVARSHEGALRPSSCARRRPRAHAWLLCAGLALGLGCSDPAPVQTRPRGIAPGEEVPRGPVTLPTPPAAPSTPPPSSLSSPFAKKGAPGALTRVEVVDAGTSGAAPAPVADAGPPRDLSSELVAKLGRPADCIDLAKAAQAGGRLNIVVVAEVMPSGRITRAQASAPDQPASALRCLEQKATSAGLRGPIPGAPLSVTATMPIEVVSQPTQR
jgi:hypothetical protein